MRIRLLLGLAVLLVSGCKTFTVDVIKSPNFTPRPGTYHVDLLYKEPDEGFEVVGIIEIRASNRVPIQAIAQRLVQMSTKLDADAVIPPDASKTRNLKYDSDNPYRPFYIFDDGNTAIVEGRAIRYSKATQPKLHWWQSKPES